MKYLVIQYSDSADFSGIPDFTPVQVTDGTTTIQGGVLRGDIRLPDPPPSPVPLHEHDVVGLTGPPK